ncbi:AraC family transcriptional regulator [Actinomadura harenae]|uniref:AraC family transcriptional regulator n=1 Tax=Actinomadura harenae TaxID=2483351 RepID=A0A3M2LLN2_9ACTN|nr:AraC family transcriptional regulator [Actinomadura harenae]RMI37780.1 AraC family transcriptional regulator [Actinomadura harenae]
MDDQGGRARWVSSLTWEFADAGDVGLSGGAWREMPAGTSRVTFVRRGLLRVRGEGTTDLAAGDLVCFPTGVRHELHALTDVDLLSVGLVRDGNDAGLPSRILLTDLARNEPLVEVLFGELLKGAREFRTDVLRHSATLLASLVVSSWLERGCAPDRWLMRVEDAGVARAVAAIHDDPGRAWSVADLARVALLSRSEFAVRFRRAAGETPVRYVTAVRIERARRLLRDGGLGTEQIARQLGYGSSAAFSRAFTRAVGTSPARWRDGRRIDSGSSTAPTTARDAASA